MPATPPAKEVAAMQTTGATFPINNAKFYVPVVISSINDIKFLENIKQGFKRTFSGNKYRSEITTQSKNNLDYLINSTIRNINRLYFHSKMVTIISKEILLINTTCH